MKTSVGIEALAVALPRRTLHLEDLARARGVDPAKYIAGLGVREMAVADPGEDTVALAATAARRLIETNEVDPASIGFLAVGTETGVDHCKPVASFVQGLVGLPRRMRVFDVQHACYGGTAALMAAAEWIASGVANGKSAIVICSDIARYGVNTAGEPTQGAGAVAMLVSARPELLEFDLGVNGTRSTHVLDFWRPLGRREAVVDGHYSIDCYLEALAGAYRDWRGKAEARELVRRGAIRASERAARRARLSRAVLQDGEEGPRPPPPLRPGRRARRVDEGRRSARARPASTARSRNPSRSAPGWATSTPARSTWVSRGCFTGVAARSPASASGCSRTGAAARASSSPEWWARTRPSASSARRWTRSSARGSG